MSLELFVSFAFLAALILGLAVPAGKNWELVDVVYYPLAACGVLLFFHSNAPERQLLGLEQRREETAAMLAQMMAKEPEVPVGHSGNIDAKNFVLLHTIRDYANLAEKYPGRGGVKSEIAQKIWPAVEEFLNSCPKLDGTELSAEQLKQLSEAGRALIRRLHESGAISGFISEELATHYAGGLTEEWDDHLYYWATAHEYAGTFEEGIKAEIDEMTRSWDRSLSAFAVPRYYAEAEMCTWVLQSLATCMCIPSDSVDDYFIWEQEVAQAEDDRDDLNADVIRWTTHPPINSWFAAFLLNTWPFFVVSALSFKFAKGVNKSAEPLRGTFRRVVRIGVDLSSRLKASRRT